MSQEPRAMSPAAAALMLAPSQLLGWNPPPPSRGGAGLKKGPDYNPISPGGAITHRFTGKLSTPRDRGVTGEPRGLAIDLRDVRREHAGGDGTRGMGKKTSNWRIHFDPFYHIKNGRHKVLLKIGYSTLFNK